MKSTRVDMHAMSVTVMSVNARTAMNVSGRNAMRVNLRFAISVCATFVMRVTAMSVSARSVNVMIVRKYKLDYKGM